MKKIIVGIVAILIVIVVVVFYWKVDKTVSVALPISGSSYNVGDTVNIKWTPASFPVIEIALIPENMVKADGTNKGVWGVYGGETAKVASITSGEYKLVISKQIPSDNYKVRIISDYNKYKETSYFSGVFTVKSAE